jgi:hypothetical protein
MVSAWSPVLARTSSPVNHDEVPMLDRHDRRGSVRPPATPDHSFPVRYALCYARPDGFYAPNERLWREATCTDLFANGAILLLDEELAPNSILSLQLLPGEAHGEEIERVSLLVETVPTAEGDWLAACEFSRRLGAKDIAKLRADKPAARAPAEAAPSGPHAPLGLYPAAVSEKRVGGSP